MSSDAGAAASRPGHPRIGVRGISASGYVGNVDQVDHIVRKLRTRGSVQVSIEDDAEAEQWRRDARAAARRLGRPVETVRYGSIVVAALRDWPANELERQVHNARMRSALSKMPPL